MALRRIGHTVSVAVVGRPEHQNSLDEAELSLYLDAGDTEYKYQRFGLLLVLSAIIASGGIILNSTATVIGAMIVAPLAIPIMGVALALTTGWAKRLRRATLGVVVGALVCLAIGAIMSVLMPSAEDPLLNPQIAGRIQPGLVDLVVALATGVVAAVTIIRKDLSDVRPGVAIAISLVPPMCAAGILVARQEWSAALGATTLFVTNVLAMILSGVATFALVGYGRTAAARHSQGVDRRRAGIVVALALVIVVTPLVAQSLNALRDATTRVGADEAATIWVDELNESGGGWVLTGLEFLPDKIVVQILGGGPTPDTDRLLELMNDRVARTVPVEVDLVDGTTVRAGTTSPGSQIG